MDDLAEGAVSEGENTLISDRDSGGSRVAFDDRCWFFGDWAAANQTLRAMDVDRMSGADFEEFVADLMDVTGFDVNRVGGPGDLGANLVARSEAVSLTVQVKRYGPEGAVSRRAVSDAVASREHRDVGSAAVVANRGFTSDARVLRNIVFSWAEASWAIGRHPCRDDLGWRNLADSRRALRLGVSLDTCEAHVSGACG